MSLVQYDAVTPLTATSKHVDQFNRCEHLWKTTWDPDVGAVKLRNVRAHAVVRMSVVVGACSVLQHFDDPELENLIQRTTSTNVCFDTGYCT